MPSTPTPKRPRSPTSNNNNGGEDIPSSTIGYLLSSVRKSVTKRMRIGYDYLGGGGGGTASGQTEGAAGNNGGGGTGATVAAAATPHAHRATLPRKEFGASPVLGSAPAPAAAGPAGAGPGGIGSPPFASPPAGQGVAPFAAGLSGRNKSGSASKVTRFADGKKTAGSEGKWPGFCRWYSCLVFPCGPSI